MAQFLPDGFEDLEAFLSWAGATEFTRNKKRWSSTMEDSQAFYDAMVERAPDALEYLNAFELSALDERQERLLYLCLAFVECAITVEMYGEPQPKYVFPIDRFKPVHDEWLLAENQREI